jgi:drug/metabolite transporter (DMT)-like permease
MANQSSIPLKLGIGLALAIALDTAGQIVLKLAVLQVPETSSLWATVEAAFRQPLFLAAAIIMIWQLINWLQVLDGADLSFVQPITSLSYVTVCGLSVFYLGENVDFLQVMGIAIVLAGVWCVGLTEHRSRSAEVASR